MSINAAQILSKKLFAYFSPFFTAFLSIVQSVTRSLYQSNYSDANQTIAETQNSDWIYEIVSFSHVALSTFLVQTVDNQKSPERLLGTLRLDL